LPNLELRPKKNLSSFRRIAIGTWRTAYDPSVYGSMAVPMDEALRYLEDFRAKTGKRVTLSHMMAKAVAHVLEKMPDANAVLRWNKIYLRDRIGVFFQVAMTDADTGEIDLSGATIMDANEKSLEEIVDEFAAKVNKVRSGEDKELEGTRSTFKKIPFALLNTVLKAISFFSVTLNLDLRWAGIPKDPFGSVMITNVGSLGLEEAYVPLVPYSRVPLLVAMGAVQDEAVVRDGQVVPEKRMHLFATFDHRVLDGSHAAVMCKELNRWFEDPYTHFDDLENRQLLPAQGPEEIIEPPGDGVEMDPRPVKIKV
jgi:pyruvate dehydrogenase E2 component (dihydrolipoamide acetyltransferase)